MTGKDEYENTILRKIQCVFNRTPEYMQEYYAFISMDKTLITRYNYLVTVAKFMEIVGKNPDELKMTDFASYISSLYQTHSSSYTIATYAALKQFGKYLTANDILQKNPMENIQRPKYKETIELQAKRDNGYLNKKEIKKYIQQIESGIGSSRARKKQKHVRNRDLLIVMLFLTTGMRCSALMKLDVSDIDFETKMLKVYDKGNKINTYILPDEVLSQAAIWMADRDKILNGTHNNALFISTREKGRLTQTGISEIVKKYALDIDNKHITPHKLRATYGTQLYNATHDIYFVQQAMKHNSPKTTELYIRGGAKENAIKAANIMSDLI